MSHTKLRMISLKQHIKYFNFRSTIQSDHPVETEATACLLCSKICAPMPTATATAIAEYVDCIFRPLCRSDTA